MHLAGYPLAALADKVGTPFYLYDAQILHERLAKVAALTEGPDYLRILACVESGPVEDVLAASICHAAAVRTDARSYVVQCGKYLAQLLKRDFDRFDAVMRRLETASEQGERWEEAFV